MRPPGPGDRFLGLTLARRFARNPLKFLTDIGLAHGDAAGFRMGPVRALLVNHPDLIREVLVTKAAIFPKLKRHLDVLAQIDGRGLVTSEGEFWASQRKLVQPAFHPSRFARYAPMMEEHADRLTASWKSGDTVDIADAMTRLTLTIIAKALFGIEMEAESERLAGAVHELSKMALREMTAPATFPDWLPLPSKRKKREAIKTLDDLVWKIIRERKEDTGDVLSALLAAMPPEAARDEAVTLFNAGHDSTAAALAWSWHFLSLDAAAQDRVAGEGELFAERVAKEALRLYPPAVALFIRVAAEDTTVGKWDVPKGTWVYLSPYLTGRDPRFFEAPEKFDPDRFAPGRAEKIPPYAWFPFGGGPHVCIGNLFAVAEMKLILARLAKTWRFTPAAREVVPEMLLTVRPKGGLKLTLSRR